MLGQLCSLGDGDGTLATFDAAACTVVLLVYDASDWRDVAAATQATVVRAPGQMKWWYVKRFLHPDLVPGAADGGYSHVVVLDEDVTLAPGFDARRFFGLATRLGLDLVQPAHDAVPPGTRLEPFLVRDARRAVDAHGGFVGYRTNFVECGPFVAVSARAWRCVWGLLQPDLVTGFG